jgi:hypothetical protein
MDRARHPISPQSPYMMVVHQRSHRVSVVSACLLRCGCINCSFHPAIDRLWGGWQRCLFESHTKWQLQYHPYAFQPWWACQSSHKHDCSVITAGNLLPEPVGRPHATAALIMGRAPASCHLASPSPLPSATRNVEHGLRTCMSILRTQFLL